MHGPTPHRPLANRPAYLAPLLYAGAGLLSAAVVVAQWHGWLRLPLDTTELLAFVSGAWTVWLTTRNNPWTWPIGVLNSAIFVALFWGARLYFDMALNGFYVVSGLWGWWVWLFGGAMRTSKPVGRVGRREATAVLAVGALLTILMWRGGLLINDAAPFLDAVTTGLSIVAQWLLMRRMIEHWYAWIAADLLYVPLYLSRDLPLTAALYALFLLMCLRGLIAWRVIFEQQAAAATASGATA